MKAIFTLSPGSRYDDLPEKRYHFPRTYLKQVEAAVGDLIIYYEPRRDSGMSSSGGMLAYFAVAKVDGIHEDPDIPDHYYARISQYLALDRSVPFREGEYFYESQLRKAGGSVNKGAFGRAVRQIPEEEFQHILQAGFSQKLEPWEDMAEAMEEDRLVIEQLIHRKFRDRAFQRQIRAAYDNTCAITGFCLRNGKGRPEVEAAHIRPVEASGPDSVRNGLALTGTVHWLFDRGLISLDDDFRVMAAENKIDREIMGLIKPGQRIRLPERRDLQPHPGFIHWHRQNRFAKSTG